MKVFKVFFIASPSFGFVGWFLYTSISFSKSKRKSKLIIIIILGDKTFHWSKKEPNDHWFDHVQSLWGTLGENQFYFPHQRSSMVNRWSAIGDRNCANRDQKPQLSPHTSGPKQTQAKPKQTQPKRSRFAIEQWGCTCNRSNNSSGGD